MSTDTQIVIKPWGSEEIWAKTDAYVGKIININMGHRLSLQYHVKKEETMRVMDGVLTFILDDKTYELYPGQTMHVKPGVKHRMEARHGNVKVIEISTCKLNDIVRIEDDYKR